MKISFIIPVYNEEKTLEKVFNNLINLNIPYKKEIIFVDDRSSDNSREIIKNLVKKYKDVFLLVNKKNLGKGFSIRRGVDKATGEILIFQDADLEYDVSDLKRVIEQFGNEKVNIVYGSRFLRKNEKGNFLFYLANRFLSLFTSFLYFKKITDMETGCKAFRKKILKNIELKSFGFEIEPEVTSKILRSGYNIKEIPVSYFPRDKKSGKKIKIKDGFIAFMALLKYRFSKK